MGLKEHSLQEVIYLVFPSGEIEKLVLIKSSFYQSFWERGTIVSYCKRCALESQWPYGCSPSYLQFSFGNNLLIKNNYRFKK